MSYRIVNGRLYDLGIDNIKNKRAKEQGTGDKEKNFQSILNEKIENRDLKISNHAAERIKNIDLDKEDYEKLKEGLSKLKDKGAKNTVMMYKDNAFIASVENNTIITVIDNKRVKDNIFTNIDSLIIL